MARRLVREDRARNEVEKQGRYYLNEAGAQTAANFLAEYKRFCKRVVRDNEIAPLYQSGEARVQELNLHMWPMRTFPHLIFYYLTDDEIRIYAVIHGAMDRDEALEPEQ